VNLRRMLATDQSLVAAHDQYQKTPLHYAAELNHPEAARLLLDNGADVEAKTTWGMTPLEWAANMGSRAVGDVLIARGARLDLWSAAGLGLLDEVQQRLPTDDAGNVMSQAFYIAARNGHIAIAELLLAHGADVNQRGFFEATGLHWAAINGHGDMVDWLLRHGADPALKDDKFQATPAAWAREGAHEEIARRIEASRGGV